MYNFILSKTNKLTYRCRHNLSIMEASRIYSLFAFFCGLFYFSLRYGQSVKLFRCGLFRTLLVLLSTGLILHTPPSSACLAPVLLQLSPSACQLLLSFVAASPNLFLHPFPSPRPHYPINEICAEGCFVLLKLSFKFIFDIFLD